MIRSGWSFIAVATSSALRLGAWVFLRWIPGHNFPSQIYTLLAIYLASSVPIWYNGPTSRRGPTSSSFKESAKSPTAKRYHSGIALRSLWTVLSGIPDRTSPWMSLLTTALNILLAVATADVVYRGPFRYASHDLSFARVGYVSDTEAKILIREPDLTTLPIYLSYRHVNTGSDDDRWKVAGRVTTISDATDFTVAMGITGLEPETRYQYATSTNHSGFFGTAPCTGEHARRQGGVYTFVTSSCLKPGFPYNPLSHPLAVLGMRHLARRIPDLQAQFMLFLGDFIYIDVPKRFGSDVEAYRKQYRMTYQSPDWQAMSAHLPWIHVLDDHDIANDWDRNTTGVYEAAMDPWRHYHTSVNPPAVRPGLTYFAFNQGPASFFLLDTRRYRSTERAAPAESTEKTMLGPEQLADLLAWLREPARPGVRWKIVASSVPLTKNWRFNTKDTWGGYLAERQTVLEAMWDCTARSGLPVIVISGDRHEFGATRFPPPKGSIWPVQASVHEFSTSPLSQFYIPSQSYRQMDDQDVLIKYLPNGNFKFGAIDISMSASDVGDHVNHLQDHRLQDHDQSSTLRYRLFVDGEEVWSYHLTSPPLFLSS